MTNPLTVQVLHPLHIGNLPRVVSAGPRPSHNRDRGQRGPGPTCHRLLLAWKRWRNFDDCHAAHVSLLLIVKLIFFPESSPGTAVFLLGLQSSC